MQGNWVPIKRGVLVNEIPRKGEYIHYGDIYYSVIMVVHSIKVTGNEILIVVEKEENKIN